MKKFISSIILVVAVIYFTSGQFTMLYNANVNVSFEQQMQLLSKQLHEYRYKESQPFKFFPFQYRQDKGLYSSYVQLNVMDENNSYINHLLRTKVKIDDNSFFVTSLVLLNLIECNNLGTYEFNQDELEESIDALLEFKDKNAEEGLPQIGFYQQAQKNGRWSQLPTNLIQVSDLTKLFPQFVNDFLNYIGLTVINFLPKLSKILLLPSDSDDSAINLILGMSLMNSPNVRQSIKDKWSSKNYKVKEYFEILKKYSYQPFDKSNSSNSQIDPRNYFAFHSYFEQLKQRNTTQFGLFNTWLINLEEQVEGIVQMPFNVNILDLTVINNIIYSLNNIFINYNQTEIEQIFDDKLQMLYLNSTNFLASQIESGVLNTHIDISNPYYPSQYVFYMLASKNAQLLNSNLEKLNGIAKEVAQTYNKVLKTNATQFILNSAKFNSERELYWQDFLGNYANKTYDEDNTFTTISALSTLVNIWTATQQDQNGNLRLQFDPQTPQNVIDTIDLGMKTVSKYGFFSKSNINAFYSVTLKTYTSQFYYPMNVHKYLNGTQFDPHFDTQDIVQNVAGVDGIIDKEEYEQMLKQKWYQHETQEKFTGFNVPRQQFAFWNSEALTISYGMSLLSKYNSIDRSNLTTPI
ncbi:transmembrane protein, putative (macronuclear) [Tetrahymena thermophila SB210]|uniref:Transmembrane protein, putative n=1 Tax=Tetrahymena thermophila (strain SB210) TaxID=312017 RepID=Q22DU9_TETTS|nr:transmembrane protein, putative [Tetrahymena thermophila SB210]EAR83456.2 transmembrane protein, putative [Tetrahymena thermophila SB210]|eukprot:XP_001031119.2 transmembrane protein, putative [Tetrahymena thermophila SB210]